MVLHRLIMHLHGVDMDVLSLGLIGIAHCIWLGILLVFECAVLVGIIYIPVGVLLHELRRDV